MDAKPVKVFEGESREENFFQKVSSLAAGGSSS
jgi:hypothetical protein